MKTRAAERSPTFYARLAGILYLIPGPLAPFGIFYIHSLVVAGNAAATVSNIQASESLARLSIVSALLVQILFIFVVLALYQVLKPVSKNMAVLMVIFSLVGTPIAMLNELNHLAVLLLVSGAPYLTLFTTDQLHGLVLRFLDLHTLGLDIADVFWGLWLFPMGYLVFKSGFLPRIIGVLLMFGCAGYLLQSLAALLLPNLTVNFVLFTGWVELLLPAWLLFKGVNVERWQKRALVPA
jgi:hypothetical protein